MDEAPSNPLPDAADPVLAAAEALRNSQEEFPIQVVGAHTTPYAAVVAELDPPRRQFVLKLIRPLPHELPEGTRFRATFGVAGGRFEAALVYRGRSSYLHYRFDWPELLRPAGRRLHKRYPFRPRERVFVVAQDAGLPGIGIAGPLLNISMGGLAMRLDRIVRLDDGMRLRMDSARFERGKAFPMLCVQDLPGLERLHAHAAVAHVIERTNELVVAFEFTHLTDAATRELSAALAARDRSLTPVRAPGSGAHRSPRTELPSSTQEEAEDDMEAPLPPEEESAPSVPLPEAGPLRRLARRTLRLALAMPAGKRRTELAERLAEGGYRRLECLEDLKGLRAAASREPAERRPRLLIVALALGGAAEEPLAALRILEREAEAWNGIPALALCEGEDPSLLLGSGHLASLKEGPGWLERLDARAGLED